MTKKFLKFAGNGLPPRTNWCKVIKILRFGTKKMAGPGLVWLSPNAISKVIRLPRKFVLEAIDTPNAKWAKVNKRIKAQSPSLRVLEKRHIDWLTDQNTLLSQASTSIASRAKLFTLKFPGLHISLATLKAVYKSRGVKMRMVKYTLAHTAKQKSRISLQIKDRLPPMIRYFD